MRFYGKLSAIMVVAKKQWLVSFLDVYSNCYPSTHSIRGLIAKRVGVYPYIGSLRKFVE
tara:strand:- start:338 stop:514 length:177 start_codon:yes stop_codon:yes gene_type:complete